MDCSICLNSNINVDDMKTLEKKDGSCGHSLCKSCFNTLVEDSQTLNLPCPMCRTQHDITHLISNYRRFQMGIWNISHKITTMQPISLIVNFSHPYVYVPIMGITYGAFLHKYPITLSNYVIGITTGVLLLSVEKIGIKFNVSNAILNVSDMALTVALFNLKLLQIMRCR